MKFRSCYVVLAGMLFQFVIGLMLYQTGVEEKGFGAIAVGIAGLILMFFTIVGFIPLLLLIPQKTRFFGGAVSIVVGVISVIVGYGFFMGFFLILAGILAVWKGI